MAEALNVASSIITLIQLTAKICSIGYRYVSGVVRAEKEVDDLLRELGSFFVVLNSLRDFAEKNSEIGSLLSLDQLHPAVATTLDRHSNLYDGGLGECLEDLKDLLQKLETKPGFRRIWQTSNWPLMERDTRSYVSRLERYKHLFSLVLSSNDALLTRKIHQGAQGTDSHLEDEDYERIEMWLSPLNFLNKQKDAYAKRQGNTGQWILEDDNFKRWLTGKHKILWCPGVPGAGKTVLASIIINHLETLAHPDVGIGYLYCSYKEERHTAINLLSSLLMQLIHRKGVIPDDIAYLFDEYHEMDSRPTLQEYIALLQAQVRQFRRVFIVVDGLDECTDVDGTRRALVSVLRDMLPGISLLVTARPKVGEEYFTEAPRIDIKARESDLKGYIDHRVSQTPTSRLSRFYRSCDATIQEEIRNTIVGKAQGMFLLARFHLDALEREHNPYKMRMALQRLPQALDGIYEDIMTRITEQSRNDRELANEVLSWIVHAVRPLKVTELQYAIAVSPIDTEFNRDQVTDEALLVSVCAGLVSIESGSNIIRLVNSSAMEYFERTKYHWFPRAEARIARSCVAYLSLHEFATGPAPDDRSMERQLKSHSMLSYAAQNWAHHVLKSPGRQIQHTVLKFLHQEPKVRHSLQIERCSGIVYKLDGYSQQYPKNACALHVAASYNMAGFVKALIADEMQADSKDEDGRTPLSWASQRGHRAVVQILLSQDDVNPDSTDNDDQTPLFWAAAYNRKEAVELLLARSEVDANRKDKHGWTPLSLAAMKGQKEVVKILLARGNVDRDPKDHDGWTPLSLAASNGHQEIVEALIAGKVDINSKDNFGRTPLSWASELGHRMVAEQLLRQNDIYADSKDEHNRTPLSLAAIKGQKEIVRMLLAREDVDVNSKDYSDCTPLSWAARRGWKDIVQLLLAHDKVMVDSKDKYGRTPLTQTIIKGHEDIVRLLLGRHDINVNLKDHDGLTPLLWAAKKGWKEIAQLLLGRDDVDVNSKDDYGRNALSLAALRGKKEVVKVLLACEAVDVNSVDHDGRTALSLAASKRQTDVVEVLLEWPLVNVGSEHHGISM